MQVVNVSAEKSQQFNIALAGVTCTLKLTQRSTGLFLDFWVGDAAVCLGVLCLNANKLVRYEYLRASTGFTGDLFFIDTKGTDDPDWSELGTRYKLYYVSSDEL
jgi:hypothetical protein